MAITLDHTIVPARDKEASARLFAHLFGLEVVAPIGHFAAVRVNDTLTFDFADSAAFEPHHYAFHVGEAEFDAVFARIKEAGLRYGSGPYATEDGRINRRNGGRGVYFRDRDGHILELLTRS